MASAQLPSVETRVSTFGLIEEYEYPPGRAGTGEVHAHREMQICLSLDFPGRYAYRGTRHDVPVGAVSVLDAWEPHAPSDPFDRDRPSHYGVIYPDARELRASIDLSPTTPLDTVVRVDDDAVRRFTRLHRALVSPDSVLQQDERYRELAEILFSPGETAPVVRPGPRSLLRVREYIAAHAVDHITLKDIAAVADLTPWHLARAFRQQFGIPPHRFQLSLRIDLARRLLAEGMTGSEIAHRAGFADQSHFIRCFKRLTGTTPSQFRVADRQSRARSFRS